MKSAAVERLFRAISPAPPPPAESARTDAAVTETRLRPEPARRLAVDPIAWRIPEIDAAPERAADQDERLVDRADPLAGESKLHSHEQGAEAATRSARGPSEERRPAAPQEPAPPSRESLPASSPLASAMAERVPEPTATPAAPAPAPRPERITQEETVRREERLRVIEEGIRASSDPRREGPERREAHDAVEPPRGPIREQPTRLPDRPTVREAGLPPPDARQPRLAPPPALGPGPREALAPTESKAPNHSAEGESAKSSAPPTARVERRLETKHPRDSEIAPKAPPVQPQPPEARPSAGPPRAALLRSAPFETPPARPSEGSAFQPEPPSVTISVGRIEIVARRPKAPASRSAAPRRHQIDSGIRFWGRG